MLIYRMVFRKNFARSILSDGILPFAISTALMDTFMTKYPIIAAIPATPSPLARPIATPTAKEAAGCQIRFGKALSMTFATS